MMDYLLSKMMDIPVPVTVVVVSALVVAAVLPLAFQKKKRPSLIRSFSFTSEGMRLGCFPPSIQAPDTIINAVLYFDKPPTVENLAKLVIQPLLEYERFSNIPEASTLRKSTNDYKPTDLIRTLNVSGNEDLLNETIYKELTEKLDQNRNDLPWWEIILLENSNGPSACVFRAHHCLGDGLSLVNAFGKIMTSTDGTPMESNVTKAILKRADSKPPISSVLSAIVHVVTLGKSKVDDPTVFFKRDSGLKYSGNRKVLLFPNVPLDFIKQLKNAAPMPITINDILMFAISQAIHEYCLAEKDPVLKAKARSLQCRALLPASLPRSETEVEDKNLAMRNKWCMVSAELSVGYEKPLERLAAIHETTSFLKKSPRAFIQLWFQNNIAPWLPVSLGRQTTFDVFSRHSLVLTNVPGPEKPCLFAKAKITGVQMIFPNVIPQVDLLSYAGIIYGNIVYDPTDLPKGDMLAQLYAKALVDLAKTFLLEAPVALEAAAKL
jgi:diacylglycerol O-acyltransferase